MQLINKLFKHKFIYLLMLPGLLYFLIYHYLPMLGNVIAFQDYKPWVGFIKSQWVGFSNFIDFFNSYYFVQLLRNTLLINMLKLLVCFPTPVLFALLLNEICNLRYKKLVQTVSAFPHFLSWIIVMGFMVNLLSPSYGVINKMINFFGFPSIDFLMRADWFIPLIIISALWKNFGWGAIIYLAAIAGVDNEMYEAATVDGAGRLRQVFCITLPSIMPTIIIMLLFNLGHMLNSDFTQIMAFLGEKPFLYEVGDVIDTFVYRKGLLQSDYSSATAVGLFKGVIGLVLILIADWTAKKAGQKGIW